MSGEQLPAPAGPTGHNTVWPIRAGRIPPLADGFTARSETVPGIGAALAPGAVVALVPGQPAAGGMRNGQTSCGKTQLACYFAESMWRSRVVDFLAWVTATSRASVLSGYLEAAAALGFDLAGDAESVAAGLVSWLTETRRPWLVVLDDVCDPADLDGLWPAGPAGTLLVTTADPAAISGLPGAVTLPVPVFSTREAMNYVADRLIIDPDQRSGVVDLIADLRCEPLALAQAMAVIVSTGLSCRDYRRHFEKRRARLAELGLPEGPASEVTWMVSADYAEQLSPGARLLLAFAALLDGSGMPGTVFTAPASSGYLAGEGAARPQDPQLAWNALLSLDRAGLVVIDQAATPEQVRMSEAVQAQIRAVLPAELGTRAARAAADALAEVWPESEPQPWHAEDLRSCAASVRQAAGDTLWSDGSCHPVLMLAGRSMAGARLAGPAVAYWQELGAVNSRILGARHPDTLIVGVQLAGALRAAGQAADASTWYQWVLANSSGEPGPDHPAALAARIGLGRLALAAGRPDDAIAILREAVGAAERADGPDHADTVAAREEYAAACRAAGRADEAIRYRPPSSDRERPQPGAMTAGPRAAGADLAAGQGTQALSYYTGALADKERTLGPDHPDALAARADLARAYDAAGQHRDAVILFSDTLARCEAALPPDHPLTQELRDTMADITGG